MFRRTIIHALLALLVAMPLAGAFSRDASAATSRVAIVKEWKGTVTVKKSGGSKSFKAFDKMSLNQGDILQTGADSSAVLQFANGSSEDDRMTVAANTTLTFSKLSHAKGTSTKVSMWSGSAWVDVKSIETKDDEFTLQTPTAIMGVRGTHLLVTVDPESGATHLTVAAGVVSASATVGEDGQSRQVHPTQNALFTDDEEITIAPVDLERLMSRTNADIVAAILESAAAIMLENEQFIERYGRDGLPAELGVSDEDLARFKSNTDNLLGGIASQAVKSGLLTQERLDRIITEVNNQSGIVIDPGRNTLTLTEQERQRQLEQQRKEEAVASQAEIRKQQEAADRKAKETLLRQLEMARIAKEEANRQEKDKKRENARQEYETKLTEAEKSRFDADKQNRETEAKDRGSSPSPTQGAAQTPSETATPTPSPSDSPPPEKSANAELANLGIGYLLADDSIVYVDLQSGFDPAQTDYSAEPVPNTTSELIVQPVAAHQGATVVVNGSPFSGWAAVPLGAAGSTTQVVIVVTAEDGAATKTYTVNAVRAPYLVNASDVTVEGLAAFDPGQFAYTLSPVDKSSISMTFGAADGGLTISAKAGIQGGQMSPVMPSPAPGVPFEVPLFIGTNEIQITANKQGYSPPQTYTFTVERTLSDKKSITSFDVYVGQGQTVTGAVYEDSKTILLVLPYGTVLTALEPTIGYDGASVSPDSGTMQSFESPVTYTVTAENGTTQDYTVVAAVEGYNIALNPTLGQQQGQQPYPNVSESYYFADADDFPYNVVNGKIDFGNNPHDRWTNYGGGIGQDWLVVDFGSRKAWNRVDLYLFSEGLQGGVQPPASYRIEYSVDGDDWHDVSGLTLSPATPEAAEQGSATPANTLNTATFDTVIASKLRVTFTNGHASVGVVELEVYYGAPFGSGN